MEVWTTQRKVNLFWLNCFFYDCTLSFVILENHNPKSLSELDTDTRSYLFDTKSTSTPKIVVTKEALKVTSDSDLDNTLDIRKQMNLIRDHFLFKMILF